MRRIVMLSGAIVACAVAAVLLLTTAGTPEGRAEAELLRWQDPNIVALGETVYDAACASCHGAELEGQAEWRVRDEEGYLPAPPHDESGHTWHHPDAVLVAITTHGTAALVGGDYQSNMMGFGDILSEEEIIAVLSYIKSTWPDEVIEIHNQINAEAGE